MCFIFHNSDDDKASLRNAKVIVTSGADVHKAMLRGDRFAYANEVAVFDNVDRKLLNFLFFGL